MNSRWPYRITYALMVLIAASFLANVAAIFWLDGGLLNMVAIVTLTAVWFVNLHSLRRLRATDDLLRQLRQGHR